FWPLPDPTKNGQPASTVDSPDWFSSHIQWLSCQGAVWVLTHISQPPRRADSNETRGGIECRLVQVPSQVHRWWDSAPLGDSAPVCRSLAFAGDVIPVSA